jgi:hypothetical protein
LGVAACVFRNGGKYANEDNAIGLDRRTGETVFSDDQSFDWSVIAEEFIGNSAEVAALADALKLCQESEPLLRTFLRSGSHSGDVIPIDGIGLVAESASTLLLDPQREPDVVIFLKKVLRLCSAALSEGNPIVFV